MDKLLDKIFFRAKNFDYISQNVKKITQQTSANKVFEAINNFNEISEVRYVGGCIRKIIKNEQVDDIDLATNLIPSEVCEALKKNNINYFETGINHGTITAVIDDQKYEITSLRKDVSTDGRHAEVEYSLDWKEDSNRRDFSFNAIYSDKDGNLFDPHNGKKDLENGYVKFIGNADERIQEDYLRILRYLRFFLNYSLKKHDPKIFKSIKRNLTGISKLSSERLIEELKKLMASSGFIKLFKDEESLEIIEIVFPQLKNLKNFKKLNSYAKKNLSTLDFIFLISLLIIDGTDNVDYFLYKFKISKKNQKRIKIINDFYRQKVNINYFTEKNLNKVFYYHGRQAIIDIINFKLFTSKKSEKKLIKLLDVYENKSFPTLPVVASILMSKYNIPEGKVLGNKLKRIEEIWVQNGFQISDKQVQKIAKG
jgi:poly(A) polymerase